MSSAVKKREKRFMTPQEKRLRKMMLIHEVSQVEIAEYEGVSVQAINNHLTRLTPGKVQQFEAIILELCTGGAPEEAAG